MIFTIFTFLFSLVGFGFQASNYVNPPSLALPAPEEGNIPCHHELNDVPNNITLHIDGYEFAYPIKAEVESPGASGLNPAITTPAFSHPSLKEGGELKPSLRYYILAEPIMYRRAGDSEWRSFYKVYPPSTPMTTDENIQAGESVPSVTSVDEISIIQQGE